MSKMFNRIHLYIIYKSIIFYRYIAITKGNATYAQNLITILDNVIHYLKKKRKTIISISHFQIDAIKKKKRIL